MVSRPWLLLQGLHLLFCSFYGILLLWVLWYSILSKIIPSLFLQYPIIMHQDPQYFPAWHNPSSYSPGSLFLMMTSLSFKTKVFMGLQTSLDDSNSCQSFLLVEGIPWHWLHLSMECGEHSLLALAYFYSKQRTVFTFTPEALELRLQPPVSPTSVRNRDRDTNTQTQRVCCFLRPNQTTTFNLQHFTKPEDHPHQTYQKCLCIFLPVSFLTENMEWDNLGCCIC